MRACADSISAHDVVVTHTSAASLGMFVHKLAAYEPALADAVKSLVVEPFGLGHPCLHRVGDHAFSW
jgi:hypothetical protein